MTAKEYLEQIGKLEYKIQRMKERSRYYEQMSYSVPGQDFTRERIQGTPNLEAPFVKWLMKKDEIDREIERLENTLEALKEEILNQIELWDNEDYKNVIMFRYLKHWSWARVAKASYCSIATVYRWHDAALELIDVPTKKMIVDDSQR